MIKREFTVVIERDETGIYLADVPDTHLIGIQRVSV